MGHMPLHPECQGCRRACAILRRRSRADRGPAQVPPHGGAGWGVRRHRQDSHGRGEPGSNYGPRCGHVAGKTHKNSALTFNLRGKLGQGVANISPTVPCGTWD